MAVHGNDLEMTMIEGFEVYRVSIKSAMYDTIIFRISLL